MVPIEWKGKKLSWTNKLRRLDKGALGGHLPDERQRVLVAITRDGLQKGLEIDVLFHKLPAKSSKWEMNHADTKWAVASLVRKGYMKLG
jgi:hypothetical protein